MNSKPNLEECINQTERRNTSTNDIQTSAGNKPQMPQRRKPKKLIDILFQDVKTAHADVNTDKKSENIDASVPDDLSTPETLVQAGYQYVKQIGEGANGRTYRAKNLKTGESVAIKALKFSDNLKNYELFKREAEVLQSLNVEGVPKYYDYIAPNDEFTECWIVQEYVNGISLLQYMNMEVSERPLGEIEILHIVREIAKILYCLQTQYVPPIIHRDIKPSNILVNTPTDRVNRHIKVWGDSPYDPMKAENSLYLIDFGAVANPQKRSGGSTVAGTVGYMAPEQLLGDCAIQSDYYSLGATALHLLTGILPSEFASDGFVLDFENTLREKVPDIQEETIALLKNLLAVHVQDRPKGPDELIQCIDDTILKLMDKGKRNPAKLMNQNSSRIAILSKLNSIYPKFKNGLILTIFFASIVFFFVASFKTLIGVIGFFSCMLSMVLISLFSPEDILINLPAQKMQYLNKFNTLIRLSNIVERERRLMHSKQPQPNIMRGSHQSVQGKVVAIYSSRTEVVFELNGKTYACSEYNNNTSPKDSLKIGDVVSVHYTRSLGKIETYIIK